MRFIENGPSIPDELLWARDEGRVVFFCGAGVSLGKAGLPDFFGLADKVISELGVSSDSPIIKALEVSRQVATQSGIPGLISADKIFGLLEREFSTADIEKEVAKALKPKKNVNLLAHNILLDLSTTPDGRVQLVTTNFDCLFEQCGRGIPSIEAPNFPDLERAATLNGIIHLHGKTNKTYDGAEKEGFVLTGSEFGRAYLTDGWATNFFKKIMKKYVVVFVGYAADDPPVQYLLEAMNKSEGGLERVYAFQADVHNDAMSSWRHKGVDAIPYSEEDSHSALWDTLSAWAERARNSDKWHSMVLSRAEQGPSRLQPYQRGQVTHIVSSAEGANLFSGHHTLLSAEWLCVFDPKQRYAKPARTGDISSFGPYFDPFGAYALDSDIQPDDFDPEDNNFTRDIPEHAWDGFSFQKSDYDSLSLVNYPSFNRVLASKMPSLPPRLVDLGLWIGKVSSQNIALWWAVQQNALHPNICNHILRCLKKQNENSVSDNYRNWRYLIDGWENRTEKNQGNWTNQRWHELKAFIKIEGWSETILREYTKLHTPYISVESDWMIQTPPIGRNSGRLGRLVKLDVEYPYIANEKDVPNEWLFLTIIELRKNLETAFQLEIELDGYGLSISEAIAPDTRPNRSTLNRTRGLSGTIISFTKFIERLIQLNPTQARKEFIKWPSEDNSIFEQLRIWVAGKSEIISETKFRTIFKELSNSAFWNFYFKKDLLYTISKRWNELNTSSRIQLEKRLLAGPDIREGESVEDFSKRSAGNILNRLHWLHNNDCIFSFDLEVETERLRNIDSEWKPEYSQYAADSYGGRSGMVKTKTDCSELVNEPLENIISKSREIGNTRSDFLIELKPFKGLAKEDGHKALGALRLANLDIFPRGEWDAFLGRDAREKDNIELVEQVAQQLIKLSSEELESIIHSASDWFNDKSEMLIADYPIIYENLLDIFINVLSNGSLNNQKFVINGNSHTDWVMEAINSPSGKIAEMVWNDSRAWENEETGKLTQIWLDKASVLLKFPNNLRRHVLVIFARNLRLFYSANSTWADENILSVLQSNDYEDTAALWDGLLWGGNIANESLFRKLKGNLLDLTHHEIGTGRDLDNNLALSIFMGWVSPIPNETSSFITDKEFRNMLLHTSDGIRSRILWNIEMKLSRENDDNNDGDDEIDWFAMSIKFFKNVWPRQKTLKSSKLSSELVNIIFADIKGFIERAELISPVLTNIQHEHISLSDSSSAIHEIVEMYPEKTLKILFHILPEQVHFWSYGIHEILEKIGNVNPDLKSNAKLIELKRRWNAR